MSKRIKRNRPWQTWWSVIGPRLPGNETRITPRIVLAPISDDDFQDKKASRVNASLGSDASHVAHYPPRDEVQSRHRLQIDVEATSEDDARQQAQVIADRFLMALTLTVPGHRYYAELRRLRRADGVDELNPFSESVTITPLDEPSVLEPFQIEAALYLTHAVESNNVAAAAYSHLLKAWRLLDTAGSKPLESSILQQFVLCMEAIVTGTMAILRPSFKSDIEAKEREFALKFSEELPKRADKPSAIRQASTDLRVLALQNTLPMIDEVGPRLGVSSEHVESAKDLYRFRSRSLSHPGGLNDKDVARWLGRSGHADHFCEAEQVSRAFLRGYCENMVKK